MSDHRGSDSKIGARGRRLCAPLRLLRVLLRRLGRRPRRPRRLRRRRVLGQLALPPGEGHPRPGPRRSGRREQSGRHDPVVQPDAGRRRGHRDRGVGDGPLPHRARHHLDQHLDDRDLHLDGRHRPVQRVRAREPLLDARGRRDGQPGRLRAERRLRAQRLRLSPELPRAQRGRHHHRRELGDPRWTDRLQPRDPLVRGRGDPLHGHPGLHPPELQLPGDPRGHLGRAGAVRSGEVPVGELCTGGHLAVRTSLNGWSYYSPVVSNDLTRFDGTSISGTVEVLPVGATSSWGTPGTTCAWTVASVVGSARWVSSQTGFLRYGVPYRDSGWVNPTVTRGPARLYRRRRRPEPAPHHPRHHPGRSPLPLRLRPGRDARLRRPGARLCRLRAGDLHLPDQLDWSDQRPAQVVVTDAIDSPAGPPAAAPTRS